MYVRIYMKEEKKTSSPVQRLLTLFFGASVAPESGTRKVGTVLAVLAKPESGN